MLIFFQRFYYFYDRREAERVLLTNIVDDSVGEPARPCRHAFQTLISQELLKLNRAKPHIVPILNCELSKSEALGLRVWPGILAK